MTDERDMQSSFRLEIGVNMERGRELNSSWIEDEAVETGFVSTEIDMGVALGLDPLLTEMRIDPFAVPRSFTVRTSS